MNISWDGRNLRPSATYHVPMNRSTTRKWRTTPFLNQFLLGCCMMLMLAGCSAEPQAPALRDGPVYLNDSAGFRFLVPQGWKQVANSQLPEPLEAEFLLVRYRLSTSPRGAVFETLCLPTADEAAIIAHHAGPSHGAKEWRPLPTAPGKPAPPADTRRFTATIGGEQLVKEVTSVARANRVISFLGIYSDSDAAAREEIRRAVASLQWQD
jgi:hypothetical protein